jgi:hypothetical protein
MKPVFFIENASDSFIKSCLFTVQCAFGANRPKIRAYSLTVLLLMVFGACVFQNTVRAQERDVVIVDGNPPLTKMTGGKIIALLDWALELDLSTAEQGKIAENLIRTWQKNDREDIDGALQLAELYEKVQRMTEAERNNARGKLRELILNSIRGEPSDELARLLLGFYESRNLPNSPNSRRSNNSSSTQTTSRQRVGTDGFSGIYVGLYNPPPGAAINSVEPQFVAFLPDGHVYWMLPPEGLLYFDARVAERAYPDNWGTYEIRGNEIHVSLGTYKLRRVFVREGIKLKLQKYDGQNRAAETYTFSPLATGDGLRLAGTYRRFSAAPGISFAPDGSFRDAGFTRNFGTIGRPDGTVYQDDGRGGTGTYLIEQNTLELRYADGRVKRFAFTALPDMLVRQPVQSFRINYEILKLD